LVYEYNFLPSDHNAIVRIESKDLGDVIAWIPYVEEFRKKGFKKVYCSSYYNGYIKNSYPDIIFINPKENNINNTVEFKIDYFDESII